MLWRGVGSVLAGCGAGALVLLVVWLWPGQNVPPSMGPVVVVPVLEGPMPSATSPPDSGPPPVTQPSASPRPSCTYAGGRAVPPSPPPEADDGTDVSGNGPGRTGEGASQISGDDEKASRVPRGDTDEDREDEDTDEGTDSDGDTESDGDTDSDGKTDSDEDLGRESTRGHRGDADDEWDD